MLHNQDLQDKQQRVQPEAQGQAPADQAPTPQYMVMDNIESDTNEVFYGGKTYKRVPADLKKGFTMKQPNQKQKRKAMEEAKTNAAANIDQF